MGYIFENPTKTKKSAKGRREDVPSFGWFNSNSREVFLLKQCPWGSFSWAYRTATFEPKNVRRCETPINYIQYTCKLGQNDQPSKCQCYGEASVNSPHCIIGFKTTKEGSFQARDVELSYQKTNVLKQQNTNGSGTKTTWPMATEATKGVSSRSPFGGQRCIETSSHWRKTMVSWVQGRKSAYWYTVITYK